VFALTPNETEARVCLGLGPHADTSPEELGRQLLDLGPQNVIVTLGAQGALWLSGERVCRIPALAVRAVDTVGAGDAFNAALAVGISEEAPMQEALTLASVTASLSTGKRETIASYPRRPEVDRRLHEVRKGIVQCSTAPY